MTIVTCYRGVGRRTPFIRIRNCEKTFVTVPFFYSFLSLYGNNRQYNKNYLMATESQ